MDQALDSSSVPLKGDFYLNGLSVPNPSDPISTGGFSIGQFIIVRATTFTAGENITFSYAGTADITKRLKGVAGGEVLPIINYPVTNNLV